MGSRALIDGLERVKNSFNSYPIDRLAWPAGAQAAMQDQAYFDQTRQAVMATRERMSADLRALGFDAALGGHFVFARYLEYDAAQLAGQLRERSILVRHFRQAPYRSIPAHHGGGTMDAQCEVLITRAEENFFAVTRTGNFPENLVPYLRISRWHRPGKPCRVLISAY